MKKIKEKLSKVKISNAERFMTWLWEKHILYGDAFSVWWGEEGAQYFTKWAIKRGLDFIDEELFNGKKG